MFMTVDSVPSVWIRTQIQLITKNVIIFESGKTIRKMRAKLLYALFYYLYLMIMFTHISFKFSALSLNHF